MRIVIKNELIKMAAFFGAALVMICLATIAKIVVILLHLK